MGRKLRFCVSKNHYRNKVQKPLVVSYSLRHIYQSLIVSVPLELVTPVSLPVSFSLDNYLSAPTKELSILKTRIEKLSCLPKDWYLFAERVEESVTICQIRLSDFSSEPVTSYTISLSSSMDCSVTFYGKVTSVTRKISSIIDLVSFIDFLQNLHVCIGNSDVKFINICESRNNILCNRSGIANTHV